MSIESPKNSRRKGPDWTQEEISVLGTLSDAEVSRRLKRSLSADSMRVMCASDAAAAQREQREQRELSLDSVGRALVEVLPEMKHRRPRPIFMLWLITVIPLPAFNFSASATTTAFVFNSFGPGSTYNSGADWIVGGSASLHGYQGHAEYFVPAFSGNLSQIQVGTKVLGGVALSDFFIAQDNGSGIPGAVLENFPNVSDPNGVLTINSVTAPLLQAGQKYWLCDEPADPNTYTGWCLNSQSITNACATETSQGGWFAQASPPVASCVFNISVVPVPEPSTAGLVLLGAGLLGAQSRRSSPRCVRP